MQPLADLSVRRPILMSMVLVGLIVVGALAYLDLGVDRLPSVDIPTVRVRAVLPGASPQEMEAQVADILEDAVNTVDGIEELRAICGPGSCFILAQFALGRDIDTAVQDVRDRVSAVLRQLPAGMDPPVVSKVDNDSDPVLTVALSGPRSLRELAEIADRVVRPRFESAPGVGEIRIVGGPERFMNAILRADRLDAYGLSASSVRRAIEAQNVDLPGGNVTGEMHERTLRTLGRFTDREGFEALVVETRAGVPIRLRDLGRVEDGTREERSLARLNGVPTVVLEVVRQSGANTVEVIEGVKARIRELEAALPPGISLVPIRDQSSYIRTALAEIQLHLVLGAIFASLVVLVFMRNWRSTLIAAVAIPCSIVPTFAIMWALGFTLNSVTMLALVLMVGIVIDDGIVVLENIYRFAEEKAMPPMRAARAAVAEIGPAVTATTLSLVVIFIPVSFMSSIAGRFLFQFGVTASVAVLISLFVSFTLTPLMASRLLRASPARADGTALSRGGLYGLIERPYLWMLRWAMRLRWPLIGVAALVALSSIPLVGIVGREFVPTNTDDAEFTVQLYSPEGTSFRAMEEAMRSVEETIASIEGVDDVLLTIGGGFIGRPNSANAYVRVAPHRERIPSFTRVVGDLLRGDPLASFRGFRTQSEIMAEVAAALRRYPELRVSVRNFPPFNIGSGPFDIDFQIRGPELEGLLGYAETLRARALERGGFLGLDTSMRLNRPELVVEIDRARAGDLGIDAREIGTALRLMVGGDEEVSRFRDPATNEQYRVSLRLDEADRSDPLLIDRLKLPTSDGRLVELSSLATLVPTISPSRIDRVNRQRTVSVRGGVAPGASLGEQIRILEEEAAALGMAPGYTTAVAGRSRELERTFDEFYWAFALSIVFMYMILAAQMENLVHPVTILLSIPLAIPFALLSLWATGVNLNLYSALGILVLFGVVKKNSILQIDHMNQLRSQGMERLEAIMLANRDRLRPILMTTLSLVAGMLPLALGTGPGAEERRSVAVVVIGGQLLCLLLTLLVTPVAYSLLDDLGALLRGRRGRSAPTAAPALRSGGAE
jgi:HAE1 family hydrophobic/amphiphilic exporter-1